MQSADLAVRLFELRWPGRQPSEDELRRYEEMPVDELEHMVQSLERASAAVTVRRKNWDETGDAKGQLKRRQKEALASLNSLADRIAARRKEEQDCPLEVAQNILPPSTSALKAHFKETLTLLADGQGEHPIFDALQVRLALDEATSPWWKNGADELANIILQQDRGNLINILQIKTNHETTDKLKAARVEQYLEFVLLKTSWDVLRLLDRKLLAHAGYSKKVLRLLSKHALRSSAFEPTFLTDPIPVLSAAAATESLAKLFLFGSEFRPTKIVSVGEGGNMIGQFLTSELRLPISRSWHWNVQSQTIRQMTQEFSDEDRILVVSDVATSSRDLLELREVVGAQLPYTSLAFTALAAQATTYDALRPELVVFFANLTAQTDAKLPWVRAGSYRRTRASHFFGHSAPSPLRIPRDFFASVTSGLKALVK
ncbi:hypothetical protein K6L44_07555 [Gluconacetobacter entanii]|uniref:hypothetical protein n=1 Tax=Gluconacetobacter entanii TaxID=108528 RepID=UPI001C9370E2|nr:hypothetical protein [Gluconacetobacter entanii]MBY4639844.1 hypothetical protein [Gluconacetobacter entanii]MCW4579953.1 hypothetical protein [Gluconacetobacter entanii]MCW4583363.1 hypothetical protein [Gluconacetobacter entanii]MCW4586687.1 hypothetical protein [Gluconacetobacter entanii]